MNAENPTPSDAKRVIERTARVVTARRAVPSSSAVTAMDHEEVRDASERSDARSRARGRQKSGRCVDDARGGAMVR